MNRDLISLEGGKTLLNINAIAMVLPYDDNHNMTCINIIGCQRLLYIKENFESVKKKLDNWIIG